MGCVELGRDPRDRGLQLRRRSRAWGPPRLGRLPRPRRLQPSHGPERQAHRAEPLQPRRPGRHGREGDDLVLRRFAEQREGLPCVQPCPGGRRGQLHRRPRARQWGLLLRRRHPVPQQRPHGGLAQARGLLHRQRGLARDRRRRLQQPEQLCQRQRVRHDRLLQAAQSRRVLSHLPGRREVPLRRRGGGGHHPAGGPRGPLRLGGARGSLGHPGPHRQGPARPLRPVRADGLAPGRALPRRHRGPLQPHRHRDEYGRQHRRGQPRAPHHRRPDPVGVDPAHAGGDRRHRRIGRLRGDEVWRRRDSGR